MSSSGPHRLVGDATRPTGEGMMFIAHVCNDIGAWGAGFVLAVSRRWPEPEAAYRTWYRSIAPASLPLGSVQYAPVSPTIVVANMIAQRGIRRRAGETPLDYSALHLSLLDVTRSAFEASASVHMPLIGSGLAGGDWERIESIIVNTLVAGAVPTYIYSLPRS